jgi:Protein of unknown function (DUF3618)
MDQDTSEKRAEVEQARQTVGADVEALAYKANAPKRVRDQAADKAHTAKANVDDLKQTTRVRVRQAKTRIQADPRAQKLQRGVAAVKDAVTADHSEFGGESPSPATRIQPAVAAVKRHPTAVAASAIGMMVGIIVGRLIRPDR